MPRLRLRLRQRLPSLVQSSQFRLSPVPRLCFSRCLLFSPPWVFPLCCPWFLSSLFSSISTGLPNPSVGPRWCFPPSVLSCPCLSHSCLLSCPCVALFASCIQPLPCCSCFCLSKPHSLVSSNASSVQSARRGVGCRGDIRVGSRVVCGACIQLIHAIVFDSLFTRASSVNGCGPVGGRVGGMRCPGSLSLGMCTAGLRARSGSAIVHGAHGCCGSSQVGMLFFVPWLLSLSVPILDHSYKGCYTPTASRLLDLLSCCDDVCDVGELGVSSGLGHAGGEHSSSSPDSATKIVTPSVLKFHLQIRPAYIDLFVHEDGLVVAKARGHPLVRVSLGGSDEERVSRYPGLRAPAPRTTAGSATLPVLPTGSGEVPPPRTRPPYDCTK